jgi:hypothetical protein
MMKSGDGLRSTNRQKCETWLERGNSEKWEEPRRRASIGSGCHRVCPLHHLELERARSDSRTVLRMKRLTLAVAAGYLRLVVSTGQCTTNALAL